MAASHLVSDRNSGAEDRDQCRDYPVHCGPGDDQGHYPGTCIVQEVESLHRLEVEPVESAEKFSSLEAVVKVTRSCHKPQMRKTSCRESLGGGRARPINP